MKIDFKNYNQPIVENFEIPSVGIEDIDRAIFKLFNSDINFETLSNNVLTKVPVVFASGERFALTRRKDPIRDNNNTLILPLISIERGLIDFSNAQQGRGSAIATRDQESYVIKKRLSNKDRDYQNLINKFGIKNQDNVTSRTNFTRTNVVTPGQGSLPGTVSSRRQTNALKFSNSGLINLNSQDSLSNNLFEIITVPYPIFVTTTYNITFWTQYMTQMNEIQETYLTNMLGQSEEFIIKTDKGYEYVAKSGTSFNSETNFSNYTESERLIKSNFDIKISGYIINPNNPGIPNQLRSFLSAPMIEFGYNETNKQVVVKPTPERNQNNFILNDIKTSEEILDSGEVRIQDKIINPFTGTEKLSFSKILTSDQRSGETVASGMIIKEIDKQHE